MKTETSRQPRHSSHQRGPAKLPDTVWAPLVTGTLILIVGIIGLIAGQPWLFPALGPTAFIQAERPDLKSSRFYNVVVGHLCGMVAGILAVLLLGAATAPGLLASSNGLPPVRMWAAVVAMMLTMLTCLLLKANHPPAAATTLMFALGGFSFGRQDITTVVVSVLILAIAGEILRRVRLSQLEESSG
jgi:hypothetical protein